MSISLTLCYIVLLWYFLNIVAVINSSSWNLYGNRCVICVDGEISTRSSDLICIRCCRVGVDKKLPMKTGKFFLSTITIRTWTISLREQLLQRWILPGSRFTHFRSVAKLSREQDRLKCGSFLRFLLHSFVLCKRILENLLQFYFNPKMRKLSSLQFGRHWFSLDFFCSHSNSSEFHSLYKFEWIFWWSYFFPTKSPKYFFLTF